MPFTTLLNRHVTSVGGGGGGQGLPFLAANIFFKLHIKKEIKMELPPSTFLGACEKLN